MLNYFPLSLNDHKKLLCLGKKLLAQITFGVNLLFGDTIWHSATTFSGWDNTYWSPDLLPLSICEVNSSMEQLVDYLFCMNEKDIL